MIGGGDEQEIFYFISAGHGAEYPDCKIMVTMLFAIIGVLFLCQGKADHGLSLWMLTGAVLCALFAGLIFVTFKREE